jgi:hypothetical protein
MSKHHRYGAVFILFISMLILLNLMATAVSAQETKTAYTRDGTHFISKERVDENIRYEYAKPGEYREVQVPLDTVVVGASAIPQNISMPKEKEETVPEEKSPSSSSSDQTAPSASEDKYPYAPLFIGLLAIGGLVFFVASVFSGRERQ